MNTPLGNWEIIANICNIQQKLSRALDSVARPLRMALWALLGATALVVLVSTEAPAQSIRIVALGASNTAGYGVGKSAAWPARLEALLRARGVAATITNAGISGHSSRDLLARLDSSVPAGTRLVLLEASGFNDRRKGQMGEFQENVAKIKARLAARKIRVLQLSRDMVRGRLGRHHLQADRIHLTSQGQAIYAAGPLPHVLAALRR
jgi:acyl-CoA thioesterase-1